MILFLRHHPNLRYRIPVSVVAASCQLSSDLPQRLDGEFLATVRKTRKYVA
jgi:hypothetical protein